MASDHGPARRDLHLVPPIAKTRPARDADRPLAGRTLLCVFAHPDDESLACGGTIARATDAGARVVVVSASHGEAGSIANAVPVAEGELGRVRAEELCEAGRVLGVSDVIVLNHPDGNLRWDEGAGLHDEIVAAIRQYTADGVITFGEDGLYWHPDHIGVHERTLEAVRSLGSKAPPLYYVTMPPGAMPGVAEAARLRTGAAHPPLFWGIEPAAFGAAAEPPTLVIDVRNWTARKLAALHCHRTQMGAGNPLTGMDDRDARQWLGVEHFRRASIGSNATGPLEPWAERAPRA